MVIYSKNRGTIVNALIVMVAKIASFYHIQPSQLVRSEESFPTMMLQELISVVVML